MMSSAAAEAPTPTTADSPTITGCHEMPGAMFSAAMPM